MFCGLECADNMKLGGFRILCEDGKIRTLDLSGEFNCILIVVLN